MLNRRTVLASGALSAVPLMTPLSALAQAKKDSVTLALTLERTRLNPPAWLVLLGDASYSLYLLHTFLLDASGRMRMDLGISSPPALLLFMLALPVVIILLSVWWFRWVEKPIMKAAL